MRKNWIVPVALFSLVTACGRADRSAGPAGLRTELTRAELLDKIKGGWAGQVIGCTFGGPTEFRYPGAMILDYQAIPWDDTLVARRFERSPGLYDDIYMDLTFVEVMAREGIDAPAASHAQAFARAGYPLWHANQAARYNILNGLLPPDSGHWTNSPHADDIDFQIEADFAGLMSPGMVNAGAEICDRVGHIMNYGDGWYGGVYVAAMYSLAFVSGDVEYVVEEGLKVLPAASGFARCVRDVVACYRADPADWKRAGHGADPYVYQVEIALDGRPPVVVAMPVDDLVRRLEIAWGYRLDKGRHAVKLRLLNPRPGEFIGIDEIIVYDDTPAAPAI